MPVENKKAQLIGFEGRFGEGAFWNAGSAAIEHGGVHYNAATCHRVSEKEWQSCIDRVLVGVCPEPIDLGTLTFDDVTGANAPFVLAYHFDDDRIHQVLAGAVEKVPPLRDEVFEARKHEGARWLVFSSYSHYRRFGKAAATSMFERLGSLPEAELAQWFNPVSVVSGINHKDPDVFDFRRKVGKIFQEHLKHKRSSNGTT